MHAHRGETFVRLRLDRDVNALYVRLQGAQDARTVEVTDTMYADIDAAGSTLGVEFVDADEFIPFLRDRADDDRLAPVRGTAGPTWASSEATTKRRSVVVRPD